MSDGSRMTGSDPAGGTLLLAAVSTRPVGDLPEGPLGVPKTIDHDGLVVIVVETDVDWSTAPTDSLEWLAPRAIHFDDVIRAGTSAGVLPFRFGSAFGDESALVDHLDRRSDAVRAELERLSDVDEYRVTATIERSDPEAAASGSDYLRRRRSETHDGRAMLDRLHERLRDSCRAVDVSTSAEAQMSLSILCTPEQWSDVSAVLARSSATVEYEGPLPPYHFVTLDD